VLRIKEEAFKSCINLKSIIMPNVNYIGSEAFAGCVQLKTVDMPIVEYIGRKAFFGCEKLNSVDMRSVNYIGSEAIYSHILPINGQRRKTHKSRSLRIQQTQTHSKSQNQIAHRRRKTGQQNENHTIRATGGQNESNGWSEAGFSFEALEKHIQRQNVGSILGEQSQMGTL
jgi:hypothetical protein